MSTPNFRFKQFTVWHDKCAMKVGTDGVLLGAWCTSKSVLRILDVGTGSGLIALMLAQRFENAQIDAIDIVPEAVEQANYNFQLSPWKDRLHAHLYSLQQVSLLRGELEGSYDLIVSNPPYFVDSLKNPDKGRELARHTDTLSYADLLAHSARLMAPDGTLALILPAEAEEQIVAIAASNSLYPIRLTRVFSKPGKETPIRILVEFTKKVSSLRGDIGGSFYIESAHSPRSEEYAELTREFYLFHE